MSDLTKTKTRAKLVRDDAPADAAALERTPFTGAGIGPVLGSMLAMIAALATCIIELTEALDHE